MKYLCFILILFVIGSCEKEDIKRQNEFEKDFRLFLSYGGSFHEFRGTVELTKKDTLVQMVKWHPAMIRDTSIVPYKEFEEFLELTKNNDIMAYPYIRPDPSPGNYIPMACDGTSASVQFYNNRNNPVHFSVDNPSLETEEGKIVVGILKLAKFSCE